MSATSLSPFDITMIFQRFGELIPNQQGVIDQVSVSFSPQQFKALVRSMTETINGYEAAFGTLNIPDLDTTPVRKASDIAGLINSTREQQARAAVSSIEPPRPSQQSHGEPQKKGRRP
jgi:hypothetical protein